MKRSRYVVKAPSHDGRSTLFYNLRNGVGFKVASEWVENFDDLAGIDGLAPSLQRYGFVQRPDEAEEVLSEYEERREQAPLHLVIMPHQNCNFRCVYCYEKFEKNKMQEEVQTGLIRYAEERLRSGRYKAFSVSWFGGEPLLAPDVMERLSVQFRALCEQYGVLYVASLTTNGYLLNESNIDMVLANRIKVLQVTLDGTQEHHDQQRMRKGGQPTYERIVQNLLRLSERDETFRVMVRMNVGPDNVEDAERHIEEMKRLFGHDERFQLYFHNIGHWGGENDENVSVCSENMALKLVHQTLDQEMNSDSVYEWIRPHKVCYAAAPDSFVVGVDGLLYKCTVALYDEQNHVGRLLPDGRVEVDAAKMEMWTMSGVQDAGCKQCFFAPACHGDSCPLERIRHQRRPCPSIKTQVREIVTLMERQGHNFVELVPQEALPGPGGSC